MVLVVAIGGVTALVLSIYWYATQQLTQSQYDVSQRDQANISSSNSSNNTAPLEQSELVVSDMVENTTKTVDEGEQVEDESEEDVRRGHLEDDMLEN